MSAIYLPEGMPGPRGNPGPYAPRHFARAYRVAAVTLSATPNTYSDLIFDTVAAGENPESLYSTVTGSYTCPEQGLYLVLCQVSFQLVGTNMSCALRFKKNGSDYTLANVMVPTNNATVPLTVALIPCAANDLLGPPRIASSMASATLRVNAAVEMYQSICFLGGL